MIKGRRDALSGWRIGQGLSELMGQPLSRNLNHSRRYSETLTLSAKLSKKFHFFIPSNLNLFLSWNIDT